MASLGSAQKEDNPEKCINTKALDTLLSKLDAFSVNAKQSMVEEQKAIEADWKQWTDLSSKMDTKALPRQVTLDVGGSLFTVNVSSLRSEKGSYFDNMFSGRWLLRWVPFSVSLAISYDRLRLTFSSFPPLADSVFSPSTLAA